ncbi:MAG: hypothetical protein ABC606_00840 [Candidatus Methanosuratincola petrocarbonis]
MKPLLKESCLRPDEWEPWRAFWPELPAYRAFRDPENRPYEVWGERGWMGYPEDAVRRAFESQGRRADRSNEGDTDYFDPPHREGVIEDPLAYYVPYPTDRDPSSYPRWGIYFRAHKMLADFKQFHSRLPELIPVEISWGVYVQAVFWHELAHHVVQDTWLIQGSYSNPPPSMPYAGYSLMPKSDEEGFCEYMAFSAVEQGFSVPRLALCNDLRHGWASRTEVPLIPRYTAPRPEVLRNYALCALYWHWGRDHNPDYRPRVTPLASEAVGPFWRPFWEAHRRGTPVVSTGSGFDLIWDRVFVTDK